MLYFQFTLLRQYLASEKAGLLQGHGEAQQSWTKKEPDRHGGQGRVVLLRDLDTVKLFRRQA